MYSKIFLTIILFLVSFSETKAQARGNILIDEGFESGSGLSKFHSDDFAASHSFNLVTSPVFDGKKAARFELRENDPLVSSGTRAEVTVVKDESTPSMTKEMWYSFAVFFPSVGYESDTEKEIISQWHQSGGESPPISLIIRNDKINIETRNALNVKNYVELGPVVKDKWQQFTFHIIHSKGTDGLLEIWQNGAKIFTKPGANLYPKGNDLPKWKMGLYKWEWNGSGKSNTTKRVVYFDNVRVGNSKATYAEMTGAKEEDNTSEEDNVSDATLLPTATAPPKLVTTPPAPPVTAKPAPVSPTIGDEFILVDAGNDKDAYPLSDDHLINLPLIGGKKLSIRYTQAQSGSVKFELAGSKTHIYIDNELPYALFGDNGKGNYYHSDVLTPGNYTLTVTQYDGPKGRGKIVKTENISFSIKP